MIRMNQSQTVAALSLVALLAAFAPQAQAVLFEIQHSTGYEELECGAADVSYLAARPS